MSGEIKIFLVYSVTYFLTTPIFSIRSTWICWRRATAWNGWGTLRRRRTPSGRWTRRPPGSVSPTRWPLTLDSEYGKMQFSKSANLMSVCFRQKDASGRWCTNASLWTQKKTVPESSRWDFLVTPTDKEMESSILVRWLLIMRLCILWNNIYLFRRWASTSTTITTPQTTPSSTWSPSNLKIFPGDSQIQICLFLVKL